MIDYSILSSDGKGGVEVTIFAPAWVRRIAIEYLVDLGSRRDYLDSASDDEIRRLLKPKDIDAIKSVLLGYEKTRRPIVSPVEVKREDVPQDRYFRDAWKINNGKIEIDVTKARAIKLDKLRRQRNERLAELDKRKYGQEYDAERQALRDLPQTINLDSITDIEELKQFTPDILKGAD